LTIKDIPAKIEDHNLKELVMRIELDIEDGRIAI